MKIAFSTLACPTNSFSDIYSMAKDLGFDGIELRGVGLNKAENLPLIDISDGRTFAFCAAQLSKTIQTLKKLNLAVSCLSSGCVLSNPQKKYENIAEIKAYIAAAKQMGCAFVRVLGDSAPAPDGDINDGIIEQILQELAPFAEQSNVTLLVETNGVFCNTERLRALLNNVASDFVGALWDIHHPFRYFGESPEKTVQNLGMYIKYVHVKDSFTVDGRVKYCLM
ncbi:MAG: sugar phosphate isomerase/epimerase family protein, partial [Clostridia bacterium]